VDPPRLQPSKRLLLKFLERNPRSLLRPPKSIKHQSLNTSPNTKIPNTPIPNTKILNTPILNTPIPNTPMLSIQTPSPTILTLSPLIQILSLSTLILSPSRRRSLSTSPTMTHEKFIRLTYPIYELFSHYPDSAYLSSTNVAAELFLNGQSNLKSTVAHLEGSGIYVDPHERIEFSPGGLSDIYAGG
jgi:hypothetical protein